MRRSDRSTCTVSSSTIVPTPSTVAEEAFVACANLITTVSSASSVVSPITDTVIDWLVSADANVSVPSGSAS